MCNVSLMKQNSFYLIQGPPGTGKTSTITGLIAMILSSDSCSKIHICAPSNGAVDEIVSKIN